jgi:hypothetical protein
MFGALAEKFLPLRVAGTEPGHLTAACESQQPHQEPHALRLCLTNSTPGRRCGKSRRLPFAHGCAGGGVLGRKGIGSLATFSGEPIFSEWFVDEERENRGDRKPLWQSPFCAWVAPRDAQKKEAVGVDGTHTLSPPRGSNRFLPCCRRLVRVD